jgi:hypothetical protein
MSPSSGETGFGALLGLAALLRKAARTLPVDGTSTERSRSAHAR